jgi:Ca2+-binding EF-hand superfamily protein
VPRPKVPWWVAYPRIIKDGSSKLLVDYRVNQDKQLLHILSIADSNSDGLISFEEYTFFTTLLSLDFNKLHLAFQIFDKNNNGFLDKDEFGDVLNSKKIKTKKQVDFKNSEIIHQLFSDKSQISFKEFKNFILDLKKEILRQEFLRYDIEGKELISVESFSELITASVNLNSLNNISDLKKKLNILKTTGFFAPSGKIDFETFNSVNQLADNLEDISDAIEILVSNGKKIEKNTFKSTIKNITGIKLSPKTVDLIYSLFHESSNQNELDYKEFIRTLKKRSTVSNYLK